MKKLASFAVGVVVTVLAIVFVTASSTSSATAQTTGINNNDRAEVARTCLLYTSDAADE